MGEKNIVKKIDNKVPVKTVLISVSDKTNLKEFVKELIDIIPDLLILSTGGTFNFIKEILGEKSLKHLKQVSDYTGQPETQGGLVKTLDFKIYLGLLTEKYNDYHRKDMERTNAIPIDMVVVNLYPFEETIRKSACTVEEARANIDIGGPCMIRASAKNYLRVASVTSIDDYPVIINCLKENNGCTTLKLRFELAQKAFIKTAEYDKAIAEYLLQHDINKVKNYYCIERE